MYVLFNYKLSNTHQVVIYLHGQIASLKAALARKDGAQQHIQLPASGNPEKFKTKASELSPCQPKRQDVDMLVEHTFRRQPMGDVGNIEVFFSPIK